MAEIEGSISNGEDKMKAGASSNPALQVSISFGRFENDLLSWEKFSSFSPNKYLEEVEKCATPGSVAQKKAYFEAHYKKIAERKAELLEQEKQMEKKSSFKLGLRSYGDPQCEYRQLLADSGLNGGPDDGQCACEEDKHVTDVANEVNELQNNEIDEEAVVEECQGSVDGEIEEPKEVVQVKEKLEKIGLVEGEEEKEAKPEVKEEIPSKGFEDLNEMPAKDLKKQKDNHPAKAKDKNVRMNRMGGSPKVSQKLVRNKIVTSQSTPPEKERYMTMATKKPASPVSKASGLSTPRASKSASAFISRSSTKKENVSTLRRNKQTAPKSSLHMSLNLGSPGPDPSALATNKKSLIMEQMGDKDIVKRAFKTFQKSFDQLKSSTDGQNPLPKQQVPAKTAKVSTTKENGGSVKASIAEKKIPRAYPSSAFGTKHNEKIEKQKEFLRISGEKNGARAMEETRLQAKPKADLMDAKTRRHSLDPNAKPIRGSLLQRNSSKVSSDKASSTKQG